MSSTTPLGEPERWSAALRATADVLDALNIPAWLWWGPDSITIVNPAFAALWGTAGQGVPAAQLSGEPWASVQGRDHAAELAIAERYFAFATAPLGDGRLCTLTDNTAAVVRRHRLDALYNLSRTTAAVRTGDNVGQAAAEALAANAADLAFVAIYAVDPGARTARRTGVARLAPDSPAAPASIDLTTPASTGWPLARILATGNGEIVTELDRLGLASGPMPGASAVALPIRTDAAAGGRIGGFLCAGLVPGRAIDAELRDFLDRSLHDLGAALAGAYDDEAKAHRLSALTELDTRKTRFFADVTHEFRTPLTLLLAAIEDALIDVKSDIQRDRLRMAHRNAQRLSKLVNHVLDFARIEASQVRASYTPTDLAQLTIDVASSFESVCHQVGLELVLDCPRIPEPIYVDQQMWEKIVLNLLSNAFKYTMFGRIEVALRLRGDVVELAVTDTGIGIGADHVPRLFERFYRVEGARGRSAEGTGIGLATVRELARWHGGDVSVDSRLGHGSQFRVSVRRGTAHLPVQQIDPSNVLISRSTRTAFAEEALQWTVDVLADRVPAGPIGTRPRILWADDNADMRAYVRRLLATDFEVIAVADGQAALDAIRTKRFDLVLADVMMPGLDGLALVDALRADPQERAVPVLLMSARTEDDAMIAALERGADEYLVKPFSARRLLATVRSHLALARLRRAGPPPTGD